ncbi:DUF5723 family protein [Aureivirga sp. CE67]|uniref:DUF5723 family protein n=1 Tax=Aureivirga sp. CE67 TaxID=1788983 RepID=UPI0018C9E01B|nr:DUF5723 family protein [Aureivirga sp. CE67]
MRKDILVLAIILFSVSKLIAQQKSVLYDFRAIPQSQLLNPSIIPEYKYHIGFPALSGIYTNVGLKNVSIYDVFSKNNTDFVEKLREIAYDLDKNDYFEINQQMDIINVGFHLPKSKIYLSAGIYQELDVFMHYPEDAVHFFFEGTSILDKRYNLGDITVKGELLGVLHFGAAKKVNEKLTLGGRLKLYSSAANIKLTNSRGTYYTSQGTDNYYSHNFEDVYIKLQTSGIIYNDNDADPTAGDYVRNTFFGGGLGLGLDGGFTYDVTDQWRVTGSFQDLGFVNNSVHNKSYIADGDFSTQGIDFQFNPDEPLDYWQQLEDDFDESIPRDTIYSSYTTMRPLKLNASASYRFHIMEKCGCYNTIDDIEYREEVGGQIYTVFRPKKPRLALTAFYSRRLFRNLYSKITYTVDSYSYTNVGIGLSAKFGLFQMYGIFDNVLEVANIYKSNQLGLQFGMNFIIDGKNKDK